MGNTCITLRTVFVLQTDASSMRPVLSLQVKGVDPTSGLLETKAIKVCDQTAHPFPLSITKKKEAMPGSITGIAP